jgi:hypothetical protein
VAKPERIRQNPFWNLLLQVWAGQAGCRIAKVFRRALFGENTSDLRQTGPGCSIAGRLFDESSEREKPAYRKGWKPKTSGVHRSKLQMFKSKADRCRPSLESLSHHVMESLIHL